MKKFMFRRLVALCLCVCVCAGSLTACKTTESKTSYTVTVQSEGGLPLENVRVNVYKHDSTTDLVWAAMTDENGTVSFEATPATEFDAVLSELPDGYEAEESYLLNGEKTVLRLKARLLEGGDLSAYRLSLGDMMCDFSVMAGDPAVTASTTMTEYTLSELLQTKKAVVLNFWFENCGPCRAEFPYLQKAYEKYADDIEVLAINSYDGTAASVLTYAANLGLTFPVIKGDAAWQSCMQLTAYPTTVVIDRYGMIALIHKGAVVGEGVFEAVFEHFIADDYVQTAVRNLSDLH